MYVHINNHYKKLQITNYLNNINYKLGFKIRFKRCEF